MKELYELKEKLCKELKQYSDKEIDLKNLEVIDALTHTIKNLDKIIEGYENENYGRSARMNMNYGANYGMNYGADNYGANYGMNYGANNYGYMPEQYGARGRGSNANRDSMGRYSASSPEMMNELQNLVMTTQDESTRQAIQNVMNKYR